MKHPSPMNQMLWRRRYVLQQALAAAAGSMGGVALAADTRAAHAYPQRPIKLVVPFAPGGSADIVGRLLAKALGEELGHSVVVENKAGAGGMIGAEYVAKAVPDGYTLGLGSISTLAVNPVLMRNITRVDPLRDLAMVAPVGSVASVFSVHPTLPVHSWEELLAQGRKAGDAWTAGSSGVGSIGHVILEALNAELGLQVRHIPFKGMGPAIQSALAGQTQLLSDQAPSSLPHIQAGRIRAVAVAAHARVPGLEDVPTLQELGYPKLNDLAITWFGVVAPAGTPSAIVQRLNTAVRVAMQRPSFAQQVQPLGLTVLDGSSALLEHMVRDTLAQVMLLAQARGLLPTE